MSKHFTKPPPKTEGGTRIIKSPALKVARALEVTFVEKERAASDNSLSGFYLWAAAEGIQPFAQLKQITETTGEKELPEMLVDEDEVIRDSAETKLRELRAVRAKQQELKNE